jgi:hypothetical protein
MKGNSNEAAIMIADADFTLQVFQDVSQFYLEFAEKRSTGAE